MSGKVLEIVLKMSLIGCYSFIIVLLVRFLILKLLRAPRKYACYLWRPGFLRGSGRPFSSGWEARPASWDIRGSQPCAFGGAFRAAAA